LSGAGIVAALAIESRPLGPVMPPGTSLTALADGTLLTVSGIGWTAASEGASRLIAAGARALISWGLAGGLDPALAAGTLVVPREVISAEGARFPVDRDWREQLTAALTAAQPISSGALLSCREPIGSRADKAVAFRTTAAVAVDMESVAVAAIAASHKLPFIAVRAIVDTARDTLPRWLMSAAGATGAPRFGWVLLSLLRSPADVATLIRLFVRFHAARRSLAAVASSGALAGVRDASDADGR
jgi:adenosylhomocysteine nucleosidase